MHVETPEIEPLLRSLAPRERPKWPEHDMLWNASTLHMCHRLQVLRAKGIQLAISPSIQRMFSLRKAIHEAVEEWIAQNTTPVVREKQFVDEENRITGICDVLLPLRKPPVLIEIKTFRQHQFKRFQSGSRKPYWLLQLDFYYQQVKQQHGSPEVYSLLVSVEDGHLFPIKHDPQEFPSYRDVCEMLNTWWDEDVLPPMMDNCGQCPLQRICTEPYISISEWVEAIVSKHREAPEEWQMLIFREEEEDAGCIADGSSCEA